VTAPLRKGGRRKNSERLHSPSFGEAQPITLEVEMQRYNARVHACIYLFVCIDYSIFTYMKAGCVNTLRVAG